MKTKQFHELIENESLREYNARVERLHRAAPELLALLVEIGITLNGGNSIIPSRDPVVLAKIKDLVAKATGGT